MYVARLVCSDAECAEEQSFEVATLAELELLACDCGCTLEVIAFPDWTDEEIAAAIVRRLRLESDRGREARGAGAGPLRHAA
jgi:hypothetical protein